MSNTVSQTVARPVRTGTQLGAAEVIVQFVEAFLKDLNEAQHVAALGMLTLILGIVQILVENRTGKAFMRTLPPVDAPVVDTNDTPADEGGH
jgi:hypothetical protein